MFLTEKPPKLVPEDDPDSFAYDTVVRRFREILRAASDENAVQLKSDMSLTRLKANEKILELENELAHANKSLIRHLDPHRFDTESANWTFWHSILDTLVREERTWTNIPWLISEFYFYRRIDECFAFDWTAYDPFEIQKRRGLKNNRHSITSLISRINKILGEAERKKTPSFSGGKIYSTEIIKEPLKLAMLTSLWGNKADLSLWPEGESYENKPERNEDNAELQKNLLADDFETLWGSLTDNKSDANRERGNNKNYFLVDKVHIIVDNAGLEFITDLLLVKVLLRLRIARRIIIYVKARPIFVSDVMSKDVFSHFELLEELDGDFRNNAEDNWKNYYTNHITIIEHDFFNQPTSLITDMPESILENIDSDSDLLIVKGDANYRRILEDRKWPNNFPFRDIVAEAPTRVTALRTLKSELGVGLDKEKKQQATLTDPSWKTDGKWGVLQFGEGRHSRFYRDKISAKEQTL